MLYNKVLESINTNSPDISIHLRNYYLANKDNQNKYQDDISLVKDLLPNIDILRKFLIEIRPTYFRARGDLGTFKRGLYQFKFFGYHRLFNLLISRGFKHSKKIITFSNFDKMVVSLICGWCEFHQNTIDIKTLLMLVDCTNGDVISSINSNA